MSEAGVDFGWMDILGLQRAVQDILLGIQKKDTKLRETTPRLPCGKQIQPKEVKGGESPHWKGSEMQFHYKPLKTLKLNNNPALCCLDKITFLFLLIPLLNSSCQSPFFFLIAVDCLF